MKYFENKQKFKDNLNCVLRLLFIIDNTSIQREQKLIQMHKYTHTYIRTELQITKTCVVMNNFLSILIRVEFAICSFWKNFLSKFCAGLLFPSHPLCADP